MFTDAMECCGAVPKSRDSAGGGVTCVFVRWVKPGEGETKAARANSVGERVI